MTVKASREVVCGKAGIIISKSILKRGVQLGLSGVSLSCSSCPLGCYFCYCLIKLFNTYFRFHRLPCRGITFLKQHVYDAAANSLLSLLRPSSGQTSSGCLLILLQRAPITRCAEQSKTRRPPNFMAASWNLLSASNASRWRAVLGTLAEPKAD